MSTKTSESLVPFPARGAVLPDRPTPVLPREWTNLASAFLAQVARTPNKTMVTDSTGKTATYQQALLGGIGMSRVLSRQVGESPYLGIMIPPSAGGMIANIAGTLMGKTTVNLNYALGQDVPASAIEQTGLDTVIASKALMERTKFKFNAKVIYAEDIAAQVTKVDKALIWFLANVAPRFVQAQFLPGLNASLDDLATVMFTSGSTGDSKGVLLSHSNLLYNIEQIRTHSGLGSDEVLLGKLPYFHSYGLTGTMWGVVCLGMSVVTHHNPLDTRELGKMIQEHKVTVMVSTPTLMRGYLKRCTPDQFASVRWLQLGSEKLKPELNRDIRDKLKKVPVEAYGATECSPGVSGCIYEDYTTAAGEVVPGNCEGSVGPLFPGTACAVVDLDTGELLPRGNKEGVLFLSGPQVMQGYLKKPAETAAVLQNGWYLSGDIGYVDEKGFVHIKDRLNRFAKVGGEMVPMILVEEAICKLAGVDELAVAVSAVPDHEKGERLIVLYTDDKVVPKEVGTKLQEAGLKNIWIPKPNDYYRIESMPTASTGKRDLKSIKKLARQLAGVE